MRNQAVTPVGLKTRITRDNPDTCIRVNINAVSCIGLLIGGNHAFGMLVATGSVNSAKFSGAVVFVHTFV
jgi:hypothetical protein